MNSRKKISRRITSAVVSAAVLAGTMASPSLSMTESVSAADIEVNFAKALQYSIYFYDANMCGTGVDENNRYTWRNDCHTYDAELPLDTDNTNLTEDFISKYKDILDPDGDGCVDVAGGFHDAGDHVEFGMPENYSAATLGWGYYEFRDSYVKTGQDDHIETILRYFNDYLMKCTYLDDDGKVIAHCYQVGDGDIDHAYWNSPEIDEMKRPAFFLTEENPQTDYVASAAASLAINYLNFKDTDKEYAEKSLKYANALFDFARDHEKQLSINEEGPKAYYRSSKWEDDYCWAAAWMYKITGDHAYLEEIFPYYDYYAAPCYVYCWNDMWSGVQCILGEISETYPDFIEEYKVAAEKSPYEEMNCWDSVAKAVETYMTGGIGTITPAGYFWLNTWGSARYNTAAQLIALVYDKYHGGASEYSEWAKGQMEYLMGDNPMNRAYIVGYSDNAAKFPHHRAASGLTKCEDLDEHRYVLYGALVGGPDADDNHNDVTADWIYNEVTIDYNAAFVGACAGLYEYFGTADMEVTPDFPPAVDDSENGEEEGGGRFWVEGFYTQIDQADGPKANEITMYVRSTSNKPVKDISVRYYFDASEMSSVTADSMELRQLYDQTQAETDYAAELTGPHHYKDSIYYAEISWPGFAVANSNKKYQFAIGTYAWGNSWDPTNDWSLQDMVQVDTNWLEDGATEAPYICVYSNGVLIGGTEPDGSVPEVTTAPVTSEPDKTTVTTKATTEATTTTLPETSAPEATTTLDLPDADLLGDSNCDEEIDIRDVTMISQSIVKMVTLTPQAFANSDITKDGIVDIKDLSQLKKYLIKDITEF